MERQRKSESFEQILHLQRKGDHEAAIDLYETLKENLDEVEALEILGNIAFYERDFQKAVGLYEDAINKDPEHLIAPYQYLVGCTLSEKGELVDALKRFQYAIEIDATFVESYVELGALLMKVGDYSGAIQCYRNALQIEPNELANYYNLVTAYRELEKVEPGVHSQPAAEASASLETAKKALPAPKEEFLRWIDT